MNDPESEARNEGWHEGYSAGLLDAAKIAETIMAGHIWTAADAGIIGATKKQIAERIRARAAEVSSDKFSTIRVNAHFSGRTKPLPFPDDEEAAK